MKVYLRVRKGQLSKTREGQGKVRKNSLYLVYYDNETKVKRYEFLKLYIYDKPRNFVEKEHNKETMLLAEAIRSERSLEYQRNKHGFFDRFNEKVGLLEYFLKITEKKYDSTSNCNVWHCAYQHLKNFCNSKEILISKVDETFLERFKNYLLKENIGRGGVKLQQNTALSYFNKLNACFKEAHRDKLIYENPFVRVKLIKEKETNRQYLTLEEIKKLVVTECLYPVLKDAFLFSCLTGLRFSDIENLTWKNVVNENGIWYLKYIQKKTKSVENLPISEEAVKIIGKRKKDNDKVFENLIYSAHHNKILHKWIKDAGIDKHITFHMAKHREIRKCQITSRLV
ncbi:site-specific integrase [Capnocytophaga felis]|uniref:Transposase n=1 Tax=Capnocytophaga felis TaxID=2267611 RepID=A0A5M4BCB7_9FLAO|nr:site-specific integrase [Capnocytophaga felis]MDO4764289.1 site-specific integrase [Flavobacteriaceae bacterium]GET47002.1 transposase [Capnocytophaga felis]GET49522.1 transposase [Capnocytophaga felis]